MVYLSLDYYRTPPQVKAAGQLIRSVSIPHCSVKISEEHFNLALGSTLAKRKHLRRAFRTGILYLSYYTFSPIFNEEERWPYFIHCIPLSLFEGNRS